MSLHGLSERLDRYTGRVLGRRRGDLRVYKDLIAHILVGRERVLHLGCGWDRSEVVRPYIDRCQVVGVDADPAVGSRYPGELWQADAAHLPFADASFDILLSEYMFEHVDRPSAVLAEAARVLRPEGSLVALTPSKWSYKSLAAAWTPHRFHRIAARWLRPDSRSTEDVYPTRYLLNTASKWRHLAAIHGFTVQSLIHVNSGPTWFRRMPGLFEIGRAYHWGLDRIPALAPLRCGLVVHLRRRDPLRDLDAGAHPRTRRDPLTIRCVSCGRDGMETTGAGVVCPACTARYERSEGTYRLISPSLRSP